jgi:hypothetical protein
MSNIKIKTQRRRAAMKTRILPHAKRMLGAALALALLAGLLPAAAGDTTHSTNAPVITVEDNWSLIHDFFESGYIEIWAGQFPFYMIIEASVTNGAELSYQWYHNTTNSNIGGTPITDETAAGFSQTLEDAGTHYFFCEVSADGAEPVRSGVWAFYVEAWTQDVITTTIYPTEITVVAGNINASIAIIERVSSLRGVIEPTTPAARIWRHRIGTGGWRGVPSIYGHPIRYGGIVYHISPYLSPGTHYFRVEYDMAAGGPLFYYEKPSNVAVVHVLPPPNYGDVNGDGRIDSADVTLLRRYIASGNNDSLANADVNGDGEIDAADVTLLRHFIASGNDSAQVPLGPQ